jgi:hypothetical protein
VDRDRPQLEAWRRFRRRLLFGGAAVLVALGAAVIGSMADRDSAGKADRANLWTPDARMTDWPGGIRLEPLGRQSERFRISDYRDGIGDTDSAYPWSDISGVTLRNGNVVDFSNWVVLELRQGLPATPDPNAIWIAYGVVVDGDGDGRGDQRIGIDNNAADHREWITDLRTGRTAVNLTSVFGAFEAFGTRIETWYADMESRATLIVKRHPGGVRFYAWAATIVDDQIVATDFAPDEGWMETVSPPR